MKSRQIKTVSDIELYLKEHFREKKITVKFTCFPLGYTDVSNSHYCPKTGVTNWGNSRKKPRSYPGWRGWVEGKITKGDTEDFTDKFPKRVYTGTFNGPGGELGCFSGEVYLFADDFPSLKNAEFSRREKIRKACLKQKALHKTFTREDNKLDKLKEKALFKLKHSSRLYKIRENLTELNAYNEALINELEQPIYEKFQKLSDNLHHKLFFKSTKLEIN